MVCCRYMCVPCFIFDTSICFAHLRRTFAYTSRCIVDTHLFLATMFSKIVLPAVAAMCVSADLPVVEVSLVGAGSWSNALSAMEKNREQMENRFVAQLKEKVSAMQKSSAPSVSRAISSVLDLHTFELLVSVIDAVSRLIGFGL